jgi:hypothetical protein
MHIKISSTREYVKGNKFSCYDLVNYLEKENKDKDFLSKEHFFDQYRDDIKDFEVIHLIDHHKKGLKVDEAKFFTLTVNPSKSELKHLASLATGGDDIYKGSQMSPKALECYHTMVKEYVRQVVMEAYANGFNKGLTAKDLVYFGKLEEERHYKGFEKDVKSGFAKSGDKKPGLQTHVHVVVARMDQSQQFRLSPLANARGGSQNQLNGNQVKIGMDRVTFFQRCEVGFDQVFDYKRTWSNSFAYHQFLNHPETEMSHYLKIGNNILKNSDHGIQQAFVDSLSRMTSNNHPNTMQNVNRAFQNPESISEIL